MTERERDRRAEKGARSVRAAEGGADQSARRRGGTGTRDRCPAARGPGRGRDRGGTAPGDAVREGRRGTSRRSFTLLLLGQISSLTGNLTLKFALSMYVLERTGSASVFAGLLALSMLPTVLLSPLGGLLADRADRRKVMVALDLLSGLAVLCAGLALPLGRDILTIGALLIALSVLAAFESPTVQACVPQLLSGEDILRGNAAVNQVAATASLVTPFLGSVAYTAFGLRPVLWGAVACFFVTALLERSLRLPPREREPGRAPGLGEDMADCLRFLGREHPGILKLLLLAALVSLFVAGAVVVGAPYLVRTVLGLSAGWYGAAESAMGVASILGGVCVGLLGQRLRLRSLWAAFAALGACLIPCGGAFLLPLDAAARYLVLLAAFCVCQLGCSVFSTCAISVIQARTPERLMGKVMSFVTTLSMCAQPVGQIAYGALFDLAAGRVYWVLIPSGLLVCAIGLASSGFFARLEEEGGAA